MDDFSNGAHWILPLACRGTWDRALLCLSTRNVQLGSNNNGRPRRGLFKSPPNSNPPRYSSLCKGEIYLLVGLPRLFRGGVDFSYLNLANVRDATPPDRAVG